MVEINEIDSSINSIYQINTQRASVNPFAPADDAASQATTQTDSQAKTNSITSADELLEAFSLSEPENRYKLISNMTGDQQKGLISLLGDDAKVLGMKLFGEEKILNLLFNTTQQDIGKVLKGSMSLEKAFAMIPQDSLNRFIMSDKLDKKTVMKAFNNYSQPQLAKLLKDLTGQPQGDKAKDQMVQALGSIPFKLLQQSLLAIKPEQKATFVAQMTGVNDELFDLIPKSLLLNPLSNIGKEQTLQGFGNLDTSLVGNMLSQLPDEIMPMLLTLINPTLLANTLLTKYPEVIQTAFGSDSSTSSAAS